MDVEAPWDKTINFQGAKSGQSKHVIKNSWNLVLIQKIVGKVHCWMCTKIGIPHYHQVLFHFV